MEAVRNLTGSIGELVADSAIGSGGATLGTGAITGAAITASVRANATSRRMSPTWIASPLSSFALLTL